MNAQHFKLLNIKLLRNVLFSYSRRVIEVHDSLPFVGHIDFSKFNFFVFTINLTLISQLISFFWIVFGFSGRWCASGSSVFLFWGSMRNKEGSKSLDFLSLFEKFKNCKNLSSSSICIQHQSAAASTSHAVRSSALRASFSLKPISTKIRTVPVGARLSCSTCIVDSTASV